MPAAPTAAPAGFAALGLPASLTDTLAQLGYEEPTAIQREAIPPLVAGRDLLGQAATGTGKTAAFGLPLLERVAREGGKGRATALVLVPTRELAVQVHRSLQGYALKTGARVLAVFGGQPIGRQLGPLKQGVDVVVATPGRAIDHLKRGSLRLDGLAVLVLDEADEMLDMGFADEIEEILAATPESRQTMLFSATMPSRIEALAARHLRDPLRIEIAREAAEPGEEPKVREVVHLVARQHRVAALNRVLDFEQPAASIVFCRMRHEVDGLTASLGERGHRAEALHGGMTQEQRDRAMGRLRAGAVELLVATDVAARGLDVDHLTHVFNYGLPTSPEQYVHRIGRVGRAGREGVAITIAEPRERRLIKAIQRQSQRRLEITDLPTVAQVRAKRLEQTRAALAARVEAGGTDRGAFEAMARELIAEHDPVAVTAAALELALVNSGQDPDEREIPNFTGKPGTGGKPGKPGPRGKGPAANGRPAGKPGTHPKNGRPGKPGATGKPDGDSTRLYFSVGRNASVAPRDLVGAIANEGGLSGRQIGSIEIKENFSLVEVPSAAADGVIKAMRSSRIKGRKATIRRERF